MGPAYGLKLPLPASWSSDVRLRWSVLLQVTVAEIALINQQIKMTSLGYSLALVASGNTAFSLGAAFIEDSRD